MGRRKRLYRVYEPMLQWAIFETYAASKEEARRNVMGADDTNILFSFTDEPVPDSRRAVFVEIQRRDGDGSFWYETDEEKIDPTLV